MKNYCKVKVLAEKLNMSEATIWRWVRVGKLPRPFKPTRRCSLFDMAKWQEASDKMTGEV